MPAPLGTRFFERILLPGDALLYGVNGWKSPFSRLIQIKTWSDVSHIEVYLGDGKALASRNGEGVAIYPLRTDDLRYVLRPVEEFDMELARAWLKESQVIGQKYDWWGLLRFFTIGKGKSDRQFCSELATRFYRAGGLIPFHPVIDADAVSPGMYLTSTAFEHWWVRKSK
jgi:hypothetical protein